MLLFLKGDDFQTHLERLSMDRIAVNSQPQSPQVDDKGNEKTVDLSLVSSVKNKFPQPKDSCDFLEVLLN